MTDEDGDTAGGFAPLRRFGQLPDLVIPDDFDESLPPGETEAWEASAPVSQGDTGGDEDLDDDWPIDVSELRESLLAAEADLAAGRVLSEDEIRARNGLPRQLGAD